MDASASGATGSEMNASSALIPGPTTWSPSNRTMRTLMSSLDDSLVMVLEEKKCHGQMERECIFRDFISTMTHCLISTVISIDCLDSVRCTMASHTEYRSN